MDYTGKLNEHREYIKVLRLVEQKTKYIEVVLINQRKTNHLVENFKDDIISTKKVSEWWGTITVARNKLVRIKSSNRLFRYLEQFETFCKYRTSYRRGDYSEETDFGLDDIAFYNEKDEILLCTTTHEGYIMFDEKLV